MVNYNVYITASNRPKSYHFLLTFRTRCFYVDIVNSNNKLRFDLHRNRVGSS